MAGIEKALGLAAAMAVAGVASEARGEEGEYDPVQYAESLGVEILSVYDGDTPRAGKFAELDERDFAAVDPIVNLDAGYASGCDKDSIDEAADFSAALYPKDIAANDCSRYHIGLERLGRNLDGNMVVRVPEGEEVLGGVGKCAVLIEYRDMLARSGQIPQAVVSASNFSDTSAVDCDELAYDLVERKVTELGVDNFYDGQLLDKSVYVAADVSAKDLGDDAGQYDIMQERDGDWTLIVPAGRTEVVWYNAEIDTLMIKDSATGQQFSLVNPKMVEKIAEGISTKWIEADSYERVEELLGDEDSLIEIAPPVETPKPKRDFPVNLDVSAAGTYNREAIGPLSVHNGLGVNAEVRVSPNVDGALGQIGVFATGDFIAGSDAGANGTEPHVDTIGGGFDFEGRIAGGAVTVTPRFAGGVTNDIYPALDGNAWMRAGVKVGTELLSDKVRPFVSVSCGPDFDRLADAEDGQGGMMAAQDIRDSGCQVGAGVEWRAF